MIAACLGLEAIPLVACILSVWQAVRVLTYATRLTTSLRLYFTIFWSAVSAAGLMFGFVFSAFDVLLLKHLLTIATGLSILGWALVLQAVLEGLKLVDVESEEK